MNLPGGLLFLLISLLITEFAYA